MNLKIIQRIKLWKMGLIFSCIKKFRSSPDFVLADRNSVTMTSPFMRAYSLLLIKTCHKRGALQWEVWQLKSQLKMMKKLINAMDKVIADKTREATDGHDGTWVAHPGLVPIAKEIFEKIYQGLIKLTNKERTSRLMQKIYLILILPHRLLNLD